MQVAPIGAERVDYAVRATGTLVAFERRQITARVAGTLDKLTFSEGQRVEAGEVLAEIEPRRYALRLDQARASLKKAQTARAEAQAALARRSEAQKASPGLIPDEELATWRAREQAAAADAEAARVAIAQADLDLKDAVVRSPIGGLIETKDAHSGQYVQPGTLLASLVERDPLRVRFRVPEPDARRMAVGQAVAVYLSGDATPHAGKLVFLSDQADESSRMLGGLVELVGEAPPSLRAGAYADVEIPVSNREAAPLVPETAIRPTDRGFIAYVLDGEVVRERILELGLRTRDGRAEVRSGLLAGEQVVVRGAESLRDGAKVVVKPADGAAAPAAPAPPPAEAAPR